MVGLGSSRARPSGHRELGRAAGTWGPSVRWGWGAPWKRQTDMDGDPPHKVNGGRDLSGEEDETLLVSQEGGRTWWEQGDSEE